LLSLLVEAVLLLDNESVVQAPWDTGKSREDGENDNPNDRADDLLVSDEVLLTHSSLNRDTEEPKCVSCKLPCPREGSQFDHAPVKNLVEDSLEQAVSNLVTTISLTLFESHVVHVRSELCGRLGSVVHRDLTATRNSALKLRMTYTKCVSKPVTIQLVAITKSL
jgi:hypothetical protein